MVAILRLHFSMSRVPLFISMLNISFESQNNSKPQELLNIPWRNEKEICRERLPKENNTIHPRNKLYQTN